MLSMACRKILIASVFVSIAAGAATDTDTGSVSATSLSEVEVKVEKWSGVEKLDDEVVFVRAIEVTRGSELLIIASVSNNAGENMAILIPTSGDGMLTSTWVAISKQPSYPIVKWSDGNCQYVRIRKQKRPRPISLLAPWLGWGLRSSDYELLAVTMQLPSAGWAAEEMSNGLSAFWDSADEPPGSSMTISTENVGVSGEMPKSLAERWDAISIRYAASRDHLLAIDAVLTGK